MFAVLQVKVLLSQPAGIELVLRKRICLRVYKSRGFGATLLRAFTTRVRGDGKGGEGESFRRGGMEWKGKETKEL